MGRNDDLLDMGETKELLDCTARHVNRMVKDGKLVPQFPNGPRGGRFFRKGDVEGLAKAGRGGFDFHYVKATSEQALAMAQQVSGRLAELYSFLGMDYIALTANEEGLNKYFEMQNTLDEGVPDLTYEYVMSLARTANAVDEPYLTYVAKTLLVEEPWQPFYELANIVAQLIASGDHSDARMLKALGFLIAARNSLRTVAYFYERGKHSKAHVDAIFPEHDPDAGVISSMVLF
jgi:hypothetical protein